MNERLVRGDQNTNVPFPVPVGLTKEPSEAQPMEGLQRPFTQINQPSGLQQLQQRGQAPVQFSLISQSPFTQYVQQTSAGAKLDQKVKEESTSKNSVGKILRSDSATKKDYARKDELDSNGDMTSEQEMLKRLKRLEKFE